VRPHADNLIDILFQYRHHHIVLVFDDTDFVWNSEPLMGILKIVADARGRREIADPRKKGHGRFLVNCRFVFITNKPIHQPGLRAFAATMRPHIEALKSRFQLQTVLSFNPLDCYHFACWMATDGKHLLRDATWQGRRLSVDASNEVLAWFAANFNRLTEVSPRTLIDNVADYRLKSPDVWQSLAEQWCVPEPRLVVQKDVQGKDRTDKQGNPVMVEEKNPEPWVIRAPSKTQVQVPPTRPIPRREEKTADLMAKLREKRDAGVK
jgi:hypothetical protein